MDPQTISILIAIGGCFFGLAGWLSKRDDKIEGDSHWKGEVSQSLKTIESNVSDIPDIQHRLTKVEESTKSAHNRINDHNKVNERRFTEVEESIEKHSQR